MTRLIMAFAAALALAAPARAQVFGTFQFADPLGTPLTSFIIPTVTGGTDVRVYLVETDAANSLRNIGLFSADVRVSFNTPSGVAAVLSASDITRNPQFDNQLGTGVTTTTATLNEQTSNLAGVQSPVADPLRILLGTFHFTGQSQGTVTLTADSPVTTNGTFLNNGTDISNRITSANATLFVAPVPEPGSLLLAGIGMVGLTATVARRRRAAVVARTGD
jgi:hypothetical protein